MFAQIEWDADPNKLRPDQIRMFMSKIQEEIDRREAAAAAQAREEARQAAARAQLPAAEQTIDVVCTR